MQKRLQDILVDKKLISSEHIDDIQERADQEGIPFDTYLIEHDIISDKDLAQSRADQFGLDYIDTISENMTDVDVLASIPLKFLRDNIVIPITYQGKASVVTSNPENFQPIDDLSFLLENDVQTIVSTPFVITDAINRYYPLEGTKEVIEELGETDDVPDKLDFGEIQEEDILSMASEAPIIKLVNYILYQAVKQGASDIHIEPYEKDLRVRYRIDGVMYSVLNPPKRIQSALISRIKIMAHLNIAEKRIPQDGRIQIKIADKPIDIRVSILPVSHGERIVMRLLDKSKTFGSLKTLGFSERDYRIISQGIEQPNGIMLLTGPTGSGKTSTLYSMLGAINKPDVNIITVEDPVEYQMAGIGQVQVKEQVGLNFAAALRSILRQDPDVIMIGETRDKETAQIAIQSALTGHLVLSTLHTNSAAATVTRLIDMGVEPFLIASTLNVVVAQRLVRKLCNACKEIYRPSKDILERIGISSEEAQNIQFYEPKGCPDCLNTGYKGRIALFEVMSVSSKIAHIISEGSTTADIQKQAVKEGMTLLVQDGISKIKRGLTTIEEVLSVAVSQEGTDFS
jgi:type II secretion system protein E